MNSVIKSSIPAFRFIFALFSMSAAAVLVSCDDDDDPEREDTPEMITNVKLTFTPAGGGAPIVVTATDPDGAGVQDLEADGPINLAENTTYTLSIELTNELANPASDDYDVTEEVRDDGDDHIFFFSWSTDFFSDPTGSGNIADRTAPVNYQDTDEDGLPVGLITSWTTGSAASGTFRILLKHHPDLKTATSSAAIGETDVDIEFEINAQ